MLFRGLLGESFSGTKMATSSPASQSVSQLSHTEQILIRNSKDVGWKYGMLIDGDNMNKIQCIKCRKKLSGGVYRIKEHIAHIPRNVAKCPKASKQDQAICRNAINEVKLKKRTKKDEIQELRSQVSLPSGSTEEDVRGDELQDSLRLVKSPRSLGRTDKFASVIDPESTGSGGSKLWDQNINEVLSKQRTKLVKEFVSRLIYKTGISFNCVELDR